MENLLKEKGFKATRARKAILHIFKKNKLPQNAANVYKKLRRQKIKTNEVTVYRTISSFEAVGMLKKVDLRKDSVYFEFSERHHHHIVCTNCDAMEDFKNSKIEKIIGQIVEASSKFINIKDHSLELFGLCRMCT